MTVTETRPEPSADAAAGPSSARAVAVSDTPLGWLNTEDHKRVGRLFIVTALIFGLMGMVLEAIVRLEGADAGDYVLLDADTYLQVLRLSMDSITLMMLVPLFIGIAVYVVPLQLGAGNIAFPRLMTASFWAYLVASGVMIGAYAANGGPGGGDSDGVRIYLLSLGMWTVAVLAACVSIAASVLALRAPGMRTRYIPPFSWASFVTAIALIISLPVVLALVVLLYVDYQNGRLIFGGNIGIAPHLDWLYIHPQILVTAIPTLGLLFEAIPVAARVRQRQPVAVQTAIGIFGLLTFGAYANEAIVNNLLPGPTRTIVEEPLYIGMIGLAVLPLLALLGLAAMTARGGLGRPPQSAAVLALLSMLLLLGGVTAAAAGSLVDSLWADGDFELRNTTWRSGVSALILLGGALGGLIAAVRWWAPKIWGRTLNEGLGFLQVLALLGGVTLIAVPSMISGAAWDQPWFSSIYDGDGASELMSVLSAAGAVLVLGAIALLLLDVLFAASGSRERAGDDPYEAHTLEWATTSPPPEANFAGPLPPITSERPLLDRREALAAEGGEA